MTSAGTPNALSGRIADALCLDPAAPFLEFQGGWRTWGALAATAEAVAAHVPAPGTRVGVLLRNRPEHVGFLVGLLSAGACVVTVNPSRGVDRVRADLAALRVPILIGSPADIDTFPGAVDAGDGDAVGAGGAVGIGGAGKGGGAGGDGGVGVGGAVRAGGARGAGSRAADTVGAGGLAGLVLTAADLGEPVVAAGSVPADLGVGRPGVAIEMLTSGTTGPPKRVPLGYEMLLRVLVGAKHYESDRTDTPRLRSGVAIVNAPLVHLGGLFRVLQCLYDGRALCLLERFTIEAWVDAVTRHRPRTVSLVPTALRMVLEAGLDPAVFASVRSVISGTAPLSPDDADAFEARYGVPVLVSYAATEFGGGVAGWNLADHQKYQAAKRGSVGRAHPGCELRVVDAESFAPVPPGAEGLLEVRAHQFGDGASSMEASGGARDSHAAPGQGWVRTTDLARLDADGFLWILGRADQAIIRGGFKVRPEDVRVVLERDPRVRAAAVVGRADARLGAVPVAAVELRAAAADAPAAVDPPAAVDRGCGGDWRSAAERGAAAEPGAVHEPGAAVEQGAAVNLGATGELGTRGTAGVVEELRAGAARVLAAYELPAEIRVVDALPRTPSGKVDLAAVRELFAVPGPDREG